MLKKVLTKSVAVMGLSVLMTLPNIALAQTCKVADLTATSFQIRGTPNGEIIGELKNGTLVVVSEYKNDNQGRSWVLVFNAKTDRYIGWVYRELVNCLEKVL